MTIDCSPDALKSGLQLSLLPVEDSGPFSTVSANSVASENDDISVSNQAGSGSLVWGFIVMLLGLVLGRSQKLKPAKKSIRCE